MFGRTGLAVNEKIAAELLQRAVDLGDPGALYMLASAYQVGAGVAKDSAKAKEFFRRAAALGDEGARDKLKELEGVSGSRVDAASGKPIGDPMKHEGCVRSAQLSPDGQRW